SDLEDHTHSPFTEHIQDKDANRHTGNLLLKIMRKKANDGDYDKPIALVITLDHAIRYMTCPIDSSNATGSAGIKQSMKNMESMFRRDKDDAEASVPTKKWFEGFIKSQRAEFKRITRLQLLLNHINDALEVIKTAHPSLDRTLNISILCASYAIRESEKVNGKTLTAPTVLNEIDQECLTSLYAVFGVDSAENEIVPMLRVLTPEITIMRQAFKEGSETKSILKSLS